jgi:hypothetical protein
MHENAGAGRTRASRVAATTRALAVLIGATAAIAADGPGAATSDGGIDGRAYLKRDGKRDGEAWHEVRRGPAGLVRRPAAAPPAVEAAARLAATTSGLFEPYVAYPTGSWPEAAAIGDVTGDRLSDVLLVTSYYFDPDSDYKLFVYRQQADGTLADPVKYTTGGTYPMPPRTVAVGDVNGDGRNDVVVGNGGAAVGVFYQNVSGTLDPVVLHSTIDSQCVRIADLDSDGRLDVVGAGWATGTVTVFRQQADGLLAAPLVYPAPHSGYDDLEVGDLDHDARADVAVMSGQLYATPNVSVLYQQPGGTLGGLVSRFVGVNQLSHGLGVGDVTADGRNDVVLSYGGNQPDSRLAVFAQAVDGTLPTTPTPLPSYDIPEPVEVADLSVDRRADVLVAHGGFQQLGVYVQGAGGVLGAETLDPIPYASHYNPHGLAVGDVDNDGLPDVAIADYNNGLVVLRHAPAPPAQFYTTAPCRLLDTRTGGQPLLANTDRAFAAIGRCGVPTDVRALSINLTAVDPGASGHLRLHSWGPPPPSSSLNFVAGRTRANNAILPLGSTGEILVRCVMPAAPTAAVHLVIDVNGYFR